MLSARDRIKQPEELKEILNSIKKSVVFTNGCFDILHIGHLRYLEEAKKLGDILVVGVNSDSSVKRLKGDKRPINRLSERMEMLAGLKPVDYVTYFDEDTPYNLIKFLAPDILVKGGDWKANEIVGSDIVLEKGGKVLSLNFEDNFATTNTIEEIIKRYCK
ncbi:MAG: D-glycero-beta-D-manno-heptose 1-phosphate adenylyltransferase [Deferribacteres bacterium]|jgi:rfaE bifunctional protein nucleotidyltransferase chain/domain|nr:D-beta-D-heptose 1-phosphate adenylyltransferase [Deferribacteraceae bacterium]MDK2792119.1 D-glycero-beta-D-manno-heptose 1-phosphate adenylyltransferase [Deferribacteres bacterium]